MNAEIVARLQDSFAGVATSLDPAISSEVTAFAQERGISKEQAMALLITAGLSPDAPMLVYIKAEKGLSMEDYKLLFEAGKVATPNDASIVLSQE